jgi:hypothetical protein
MKTDNKYKYSNAIINAIDNKLIDTEDIKSSFNEYLYAKGFSFEDVISYTDEHFENLLTFKENEINFLEFHNKTKTYLTT